MYVNINNLFKLENPLMLPLLLILKHAPKEDVSKRIESLGYKDTDFAKLQLDGYIKFIKGNKKQNLLQKMRLDKKGTKYLNELDEPMVEDQDIQIFDWLAGIYKQMGKEIGNGKKTKRLIASFREKSGIEKNRLAYLCNVFINDDAEQEWSFKLEYVFWKPTNLYQTKFVLEDSRLWKYYNKRKEFFDREFKTIE